MVPTSCSCFIIVFICLLWVHYPLYFLHAASTHIQNITDNTHTQKSHIAHKRTHYSHTRTHVRTHTQTPHTAHIRALQSHACTHTHYTYAKHYTIHIHMQNTHMHTHITYNKHMKRPNEQYSKVANNRTCRYVPYLPKGTFY